MADTYMGTWLVCMTRANKEAVVNSTVYLSSKSSAVIGAVS